MCLRKLNMSIQSLLSKQIAESQPRNSTYILYITQRYYFYQLTLLQLLSITLKYNWKIKITAIKMYLCNIFCKKRILVAHLCHPNSLKYFYST